MNRSDHSIVRSLGAADWLGLAASPVFAIMAFLTAEYGRSGATLICSVTDSSSPMTGMTLMYALMAIVHSAPWLKQIRKAS